jgi:hypothetical protein
LIPVNIRRKLKEQIPDSYLGAAVDFATAERDLAKFGHYHHEDPQPLVEAALIIREAINRVDEPYIRQMIALAGDPNPSIDVRDLMASNMDRTGGADMYITSWEKFDLYNATLELGLGPPDWVRKPWSKDPGSCVIMPDDSRKPFLEVLVQMAVPDMEVLLKDKAFMYYIDDTID